MALVPTPRGTGCRLDTTSAVLEVPGQFLLPGSVRQFDCFLSNPNGVAESTGFGVGGGQHVQGIGLPVARDLTKPLRQLNRFCTVAKARVSVSGENPGQPAESQRPIGPQPQSFPILGNRLRTLPSRSKAFPKL